jgi:hypothetical protein
MVNPATEQQETFAHEADTRESIQSKFNAALQARNTRTAHHTAHTAHGTRRAGLRAIAVG